MKNLKKLLALLLSATVLISLAACGGSDDKKPEADVNVENDAAEGEDAGNGEYDLSNPDIVIGEEDFDAMDKLVKDNANFEVEVGTVVKITGYFDFKGNPSIMLNGDGVRVGSTLILDGMDKADYPAIDTKIEITGIYLEGEFVPELHVPEGNLKVLE